jgi:hypothetical protein
MTSFGGKNIAESGVDEYHWKSYLPIHPTPCHPLLREQPLHLEDGAKMRKLSYINTRGTYRTPLVLLEKYDRTREVFSHRLTYQSLEALGTACRLPSLYASRDEQSATRDSLPCNIVQASSRPPLSPLIYCYTPSKEPAQNAFGDLPGPSSPHATEQQSLLLPAVSASRSYVSHTGVHSMTSPRWQGYYDLSHVRGHYVGEPPKLRRSLNILRTLSICLVCCMGIMLPGLLGYYLFLGIRLLFRHIVIVQTAAKAHILAIANHIVSFGRAVASPFIAVGKGVAGYGGRVAHLVEVIAPWAKQLKGKF